MELLKELNKLSEIPKNSFIQKHYLAIWRTLKTFISSQNMIEAPARPLFSCIIKRFEYESPRRNIHNSRFLRSLNVTDESAWWVLNKTFFCIKLESYMRACLFCAKWGAQKYTLKPFASSQSWAVPPSLSQSLRVGANFFFVFLARSLLVIRGVTGRRAKR